MNIDKLRHKHNHVQSFFRRNESGFVEVIFDDFRNFHTIGRYLHGYNSIGII